MRIRRTISSCECIIVVVVVLIIIFLNLKQIKFKIFLYKNNFESRIRIHFTVVSAQTSTIFLYGNFPTRTMKTKQNEKPKIPETVIGVDDDDDDDDESCYSSSYGSVHSRATGKCLFCDFIYLFVYLFVLQMCVRVPQMTIYRMRHLQNPANLQKLNMRYRVRVTTTTLIILVHRVVALT